MNAHIVFGKRAHPLHILFVLGSKVSHFSHKHPDYKLPLRQVLPYWFLVWLLALYFQDYGLYMMKLFNLILVAYFLKYLSKYL